MSIIDAILLAVLQGLTEFLPISSSGHLVLAQHLLDLNSYDMISFDVFVHFGTLISVFVIFRKDIVEIIKAFVKASVSIKITQEYKSNEYFRQGVAILIGSIPAAVIGIFFREAIEATFKDPKLAAVNLVITGLILFLTRLAKPTEGKQVGIISAFVIGIAQAVAILPGISRSGTTISAAIYLKIPPVKAARFSFLLSLPVIAGAALLEGYRLFENNSDIGLMPILVGTIVAAIAGYFAIKILLRITEKGKFRWFAFYCLILGIIGIIFIG